MREIVPAERFTEPPPFLSLLANKQRWQMVRSLALGDRRVSELVALLEAPQNLVSYHLRQLRGHGVVRERRSSADQRDVYYSLNLSQLRGDLSAAAESLHPGLDPWESTRSDGSAADLQPGIRILFLCTHNSARSQMAEGLLRGLSEGRVEAFSAGTEPSRVHPLAIAAMDAEGIDIRGQRSKSLDEYLGQTFDYVISVCDRAGESCPVFPGAPERIHWSIPDPAAVEGPDERKLRAFQEALIDLRTRIGFFLVLLRRSGGRQVMSPAVEKGDIYGGGSSS